MKYSNEQSLKEIIDELVKAYRLEEGITESKIITSWEKIAGTLIFNHTVKIYIRKKNLYIKLDSPALKHELLLSKSKLIKKINKTIGKNLIEEINFL